jgi:hypothetical protein
MPMEKLGSLSGMGVSWQGNERAASDVDIAS